MYWLAFITYHVLWNHASVRTLKANSPRQIRSAVDQNPACPTGCTSCSTINGCVTCQPRMFLLFLRSGMRQTGACTHTCPSGYYGVRSHELSVCQKCNIEHCNACFSRRFCARCVAPYVAYKGSCIAGCPKDLFYANYSKECRSQVDCMVGPWSTWGFCTKNRQTCGYKYGFEARTRDILEHPSSNGVPCLALTESRRCRMVMRYCADFATNRSDLSKKMRRRNKRRKKKKKKKKRKREKNRKRRRRRRRKEKKRKRKNKWKGKKREKSRKNPNIETNEISGLTRKES